MTHTRPKRRNPPWTIEEFPGGKWLFTHPSGKFQLSSNTDGSATFVGLGRKDTCEDVHRLGPLYVASPCDALMLVMAYLEGWREEWGRRHECQPSWRAKR